MFDWLQKGVDAVVGSPERAKQWMKEERTASKGDLLALALAGASLGVAGTCTCHALLVRRRRRGGGRSHSTRGNEEEETRDVAALQPEGKEERESGGRAARRCEGDLSARASLALRPALSYLDIFLQALGNQWTPTNSEGYICLLIAENKLSTELVSKRFKQVKSIPESVFAYDSFRGNADFRAAVAQYAELTFASGTSIDPELLSISSGCGAVIDNVCFSLCNPGSEVLIPAPYYPAFDNDLRVKSKVEPVPVMCSASMSSSSSADGDGGGGFLPSNEDLDRTFSACKDPRILILTNPHNPLGVVISAREVLRCIKWALQKGMHVISDEIYANSIYSREHHEEFKSAIALMPELCEMLGEALVEERLHTIFGFSKDFCSSGLRIGCLYTRNQSLLSAQDNVGYFCGVSNHTGYIMTKVLEDTGFIQKFISKNHKRLANSYEKLSERLTEAGIDFLPANAGMFVWVNLQKYLKEKTFEAERSLWTALAQDAKVLFTPGQDCHAKEPGFFRVCFAWMPEQALVLAIDRVKKYLEKCS